MKGKITFFLWVLWAAVSFMPHHANALGIGVSPGVIDLGDVQRGSKLTVSFYLISNTNKPIPVHLSYIPVHRDVFMKESKSPYVFVPQECSEEDISSWIEFTENPYLLDPSNVKVIKLPDGTEIRYNQKATFILRVPKNAEPGYHAGAINIIPSLNPGVTGGAGVATIGITRLLFFFRVPGVAIREGEIIDFEAEREAQDRVRVDVLFKNSGTTTISATLKELRIYDEYGNVKKLLVGSTAKVKPGETVILSGYWYDEKGVPSGDVKARAVVNYMTGSSVKEDTLRIPAEIVAKAKKVKPKREFPWWLVIIIVSLIALYIYWRM